MTLPNKGGAKLCPHCQSRLKYRDAGAIGSFTFEGELPEDVRNNSGNFDGDLYQCEGCGEKVVIVTYS